MNEKKNMETMLNKNCIAPVFNDEYASNDATTAFENLRIPACHPSDVLSSQRFLGPVPNNFIRIMESPHSLLHTFDCNDS